MEREQVVGRGLLRTWCEVNPESGLFVAEYLSILSLASISFSIVAMAKRSGAGNRAAQVSGIVR